MSANDLNFDLDVQELPVTIGGKKFILREASGDAVCKYRNSIIKATKLGPDGRPSSMDGIADAEPLLVSCCLFELKEHQGQTKEYPVLLQTVRGWPNRIQRTLFDKLKTISLLDAEDTEEVLQERLVATQKRLEEIRNGDDTLKKLVDRWGGWLELASELGKHLHEAISWRGPITNRQYLVWKRWLKERWNKPDKTDHYLMQIAADIRRSNAKNPSQVNMEQLKLKFKDAKAKPRESLTPEQASAIARTRHLGMLGKKAKVVYITKEEAEARRNGA